MAKYRDTFETIGGRPAREIEAIFYDGSEAQARELMGRFPGDLSICTWRPDASTPETFHSLGEIHGNGDQMIPGQIYIVITRDRTGKQRAHRSGYDRASFERRYELIEG